MSTSPFAHARSIAFVVLAFGMHAASARPVTAIEFYDLYNDRYFITADPIEIGMLGHAPFFGFLRTGVRYKVEDSAAPGTVPVCRFFSTAFGKPTHFFTADAAECSALKLNPLIAYEGIGFHAPLPDASGHCAAKSTPVFRLFSTSYDGAPSHVYTPFPSRADRFAEHGFTRERVAFCVPTSTDEAMARDADLAGTTWNATGYDPYNFRFEGSPVALSFQGPVQSMPLGNDFGAVGQYLTSILPLHFYWTQPATHNPEGPGATLAGGWNPLADVYDVFQVSVNVYNSPGDVVGGAYEFDVDSSVVPHVCARPIVFNAGPDGAAISVHPLQPLLIANHLSICKP